MQRVLIKAAGRFDADIEVLDRLKEHVDSGHRSNLPAQFLNHLGHRRPLGAGLELNVESAAIHPHSGAHQPDFVVVGGDIGAGADDGFDLELLLHHPGK